MPGIQVITPYIQANFVDLPIKKIIIGPKLEKDNSILGLEKYLKKLNIKNIEIIKSEIKLR